MSEMLLINHALRQERNIGCMIPLKTLKTISPPAEISTQLSTPMRVVYNPKSGMLCNI
jgi:hypothetical protein